MTFRELIALHDEEFIAAAYRAILGRAPAHSETALLEELRGGASKTAILCTLRDSAAGQAVGAQIPGLKLHAALESARNIPFAGHFAAILLEKFNFPGLAHRIVANDRFTRYRHRRLEAELSEIHGALLQVRDALARADSVRVTAERFETLERSVAGIGYANADLRQALANVENSVATMSIELASLVDVKHQRLQAQMADVAEDLARIRRSLDARPE